MCFTEYIFNAIKNNPAVFVAFLTFSITVFKIWWDKYQDDEKKEIEKRENFEYFNVLLNSTLISMKEQAKHFKVYGEGLENSFYGSNPFSTNTFINLDVFLKFDQNKFYKAYLFHFKKKGIDTNVILSNFDKIYEYLSEFDEINKYTRKYYYDYLDFLDENTKLVRNELKKNIFSGIGKLVTTNKNDFSEKLASLQDTTIKSIVPDEEKNASEDNTNLQLKKFNKHYAQLLELNNFSVKVMNEIRGSGLLHNDEFVSYIYYECFKLVEVYESVNSRRDSSKNAFYQTYLLTKERYEQLETLIASGK